MNKTRTSKFGNNIDKKWLDKLLKCSLHYGIFKENLAVLQHKLKKCEVSHLKIKAHISISKISIRICIIIIFTIILISSMKVIYTDSWNKPRP